MRRYLPAMVVFSSVLALAVAGFWFSLQGFRRDTGSDFEASAHTTAGMLQYALSEKLLLEDLTGLRFSPRAVFEQVLQLLPQQGIAYTLTEPDSRPGQGGPYRYGQETAQDLARRWQLTQWQPQALTLPVQAAGQQWTLVAQPAAGYMSSHQPDSAWFILSVGLLLACILASYLVEQARSSERIKATESERLSLENQLFRSQKMEAIGRLVGGIAHDFNNLLTSIIGYAELALHERDARRSEEYLQLIQQGGEKGRGLIRKLLSFSRNEPTQNMPVQLAPLVESTLSMLKPVMPARIDIRFSSERDLPRVSIDPTSLDQVLVNLCINARDAIEHKGSISISLRQHHIEEACCSSCAASFGGHHVALCVEDSGAGIPPEALARIFRPFYTTKEAGKGTGLGLSIIHNIAHGCRGHVLVSSQPGVKTQFRLFFPVAEESLEAPRLKAG